MISMGIILSHYKRKDIQQEMLRIAENKEIAVKFDEKGFGKRPDVINYSSDILEFAKQGATSFHCSEENWFNVLQLSPELSKKDLNKLRKSWDLVLDIDCKWLEYSKIAADLLIKALRYHNIKSVTCKFSGNHGFHIAVPAESFPEKIFDTETRLFFPDAPKKIALYLKNMIKDKLADGILKIDDINTIVKKTKKKFEELVKNQKFDPFEILEIDTLLISSRHMFRMPYSLNEKSGLVSIPIPLDNILKFKKESAAYDKFVFNPKLRYLDREKAVKDEAKELLIQASDFSVKENEQIKKIVENKEKEESNKKNFEFNEQAVPEDFFPPCIKNIKSGLKDGKKRSLFVIVNFLTCCGWGYDKVKEFIDTWNSNNEKAFERLRQVLINSQLKYHAQMKKKVPPPNCENKAYYADIGVCKPDELCKRVKNPLQYAKRKLYFFNQDNIKAKKGRTKRTEEEKAFKKAKKQAKSKSPKGQD